MCHQGSHRTPPGPLDYPVDEKFARDNDAVAPATTIDRDDGQKADREPSSRLKRLLLAKQGFSSKREGLSVGKTGKPIGRSLVQSSVNLRRQASGNPQVPAR